MNKKTTIPTCPDPPPPSSSSSFSSSCQHTIFLLLELTLSHHYLHDFFLQPSIPESYLIFKNPSKNNKFYCILSIYTPPVTTSLSPLPDTFHWSISFTLHLPFQIHHAPPRFYFNLSFDSSFFLPLEETPTHSSIPCFPPGLQNSCSPPSLISPQPKPWSFLPPVIHPKPTSFKFPAFHPESPYNVHLVYPVFPAPSLSLPQISCLFPTVLCFPLPSLLSPAPLLFHSVC